MSDKDKIIEGLIKSKVEIIADRNERFAVIQTELQLLSEDLKEQLGTIANRINQSKNE